MSKQTDTIKMPKMPDKVSENDMLVMSPIMNKQSKYTKEEFLDKYYKTWVENEANADNFNELLQMWDWIEGYKQEAIKELQNQLNWHAHNFTVVANEGLKYRCTNCGIRLADWPFL